MGTTPDEAGARDRFGRNTIERLRLAPGAHVLDVCCGSGASALAAAEQVGPTGSVLGLDVAANLLGLARTKAAERGLRNIEFRVGDLLDLRVRDEPYDAVVCVFGIFFVPDMPAAIGALWRVVRPGGRLAITTWGPDFFEPGSAAFWASVREVRPDLDRGFHPWDRISDPASVRALLQAGGADPVEATAEAGTHPIPSPEAWWSAVLDSGYRGTFEQLSDKDREQVRTANLSFIRASGTRAVQANVIYAVATKLR